MKTFFVRLSVFTTVMLLPYMGSSYAACGGGSPGPGYTPPSSSAAEALSLLNKTPPPSSPPKTAVPPKAVTAAPPVTTTPVPSTAKTATTITPATAPTVVGKVAWIKGTLKVVGADKKIRILQTGSPIYAEDTLVTDSNSQAQVVFSDHTLMTFDKSTVFNVTKYNYHPQEHLASAGTFVGNLVAGIINMHHYRMEKWISGNRDPHSKNND